ncbi:MAG: elongation factor P [Candidatus Marinimicrobia bacterium]|nr:elongation factor P [Candidatus Neomarinimicrobiota bacterium]
MATTADIRNGLVIEYKGHRLKIIKFLHVKPGKGGAFVRTKLKNIVTGQVIDVTFRGGQKIFPVRVDTNEMQYLYSDSDSAIFMNNETFDQVPIPLDKIADESKLLKEGMNVEVSFVGEEVIGIKLPVFVELEVKETDPGVKGNTASGGSKPAVLETGYTLSVPLFINVGDKLKIDTRTGEYSERVR